MADDLPPGKRGIMINYKAIGEAYDAAANVLRGYGERPVAMLVVAAQMVRFHAKMAGTPVEVTLANVRDVIEQLERSHGNPPKC